MATLSQIETRCNQYTLQDSPDPVQQISRSQEEHTLHFESSEVFFQNTIQRKRLGQTGQKYVQAKASPIQLCYFATLLSLEQSTDFTEDEKTQIFYQLYLSTHKGLK